ncbi:hypothetical protein ACFUMI_25285, partial [Streptomyces sp. NPDC057273]
MKLSEWAARNGVHYQTAWAWAKEGRMPVPVVQTPSGMWLVEESAPEIGRRVSGAEPAGSGKKKRRGFEARPGFHVVGHRLALDPNASALQALASHCGAARVAYNWAVRHVL